MRFPLSLTADMAGYIATRSEERREGKSVDLGGRRIIKKKKPMLRMDYAALELLHVGQTRLMSFVVVVIAAAHVEELFFFSSRRRHTSSLCDWSSDVCSSD